MGMTLCETCGDRVVRGVCQNKDCGKGGQIIPPSVHHLGVSILNYYNYSAAKGVLHPTRHMAIERAYRGVFISQPNAPNYEYLRNLGSAASVERANALVRILAGLISKSGGAHASDANLIRLEDINYIREKYNATDNLR